MTESELLLKLNEESQINVPDLFDKIMLSAQDEGLIKPAKKSKGGSSRAAAAGGSKAKIAAIIAALAVTATVGAAVGIALAVDNANQSNTTTSEAPDNTPGETPGDSTGDNTGDTPGGDTEDTPPAGEETHRHEMTPVEYLEATCQRAGNIAYYICEGCDKWFEDEEGVIEITDRDSVILPQEAEHRYVDNVCSWCGDIKYTDGLKYTLKGSYYEVSGIGDATDLHIYIPATYSGKPVKSIGENAFYKTTVKSVHIPDSVTSIGDYAFHGCANLESINIPDGVTRLGTWFADACPKLKTVEIGANSSINYIGENAFSGDRNLENFTVPNGVTYIGEGAFDNCSSLTELVIPSGVTTIKEGTFWGCTNLQRLTFQGVVTSFGRRALWYCQSLLEIRYGGTTAQWNSISRGEEWNGGSGEYTVVCSNGNLSKS